MILLSSFKCFIWRDRLCTVRFSKHCFQKRQINLKHIESRPSKSNKKDYEFYVDIDAETASSESVKLVVEDLKSKAKSVVLHNEESGRCNVIHQEHNILQYKGLWP